MYTLDVHYASEQPGQWQVYRRCIEAFRQRGLKLVLKPDAEPDGSAGADAFVLSHSFTHGLGRIQRPVAIEERADSAMPIYRRVAESPIVRTVSKVALVRRDWFNIGARRAHAWLIDGSFTGEALAPLSQSAADKYLAGINYAMYDDMEPRVVRAQHWTEANYFARPIDVLFIGRTEYSHPVLSHHRQSLCAALRAIRGMNVICAEGRTLSRSTYFELSAQAKIVVSPWGYGEFCYRDVEALLDESILVKPQSTFISTLGNFLVAGQTYFPCQPDWSDLEAVIKAALAKRSDLWSQARNARQNAVDWFQPGTIADWWMGSVGARLFR